METFFPRYWPFVRGIHRWPVNSLHKGQWRGALMFSLICAWTNSWVNNREAGDLRRHHAHYDVIVMFDSQYDIILFTTSRNTTHQWRHYTMYSAWIHKRHPISRVMTTLIARFMGSTWAHLWPTGPRWAPCWPHELCYLWSYWMFRVLYWDATENGVTVFCYVIVMTLVHFNTPPPPHHVWRWLDTK